MIADQGSPFTGWSAGMETSFEICFTEGAPAGDVLDDLPPDELASHCLPALAAASSLASEAAVHRLVAVTLAGMRPER